MSHVFEKRVAAATDDYSIVWNGSAWVAEPDPNRLFIGTNTTTSYKTGFGARFLAVTIPKGSRIDAAYITVQATYNRTGTTVNAVIRGEDVDDAATFSNLADYQARRGTIVGGANDNYITTASASWSNIAAWTKDSNYNTPDFSAVVQEIIDRAGWVSGNDIVIFVDDHAGASTYTAAVVREPKSYNASSAAAPFLHVEYTPPLGPQMGFVNFQDPGVL